MTQEDTNVGHHANQHYGGFESFFHSLNASSMPNPTQISRTRDTSALQACFPSSESLSRILAGTTALLQGGEDPLVETGHPASEHRGSPHQASTIFVWSLPRGEALTVLECHLLQACTTQCRQGVLQSDELWRVCSFDLSASSSLALRRPFLAKAAFRSPIPRRRMDQDQREKALQAADACDWATWCLALAQILAREGLMRNVLYQVLNVAREV